MSAPSFAQERLWSVDQLERGSPLFNAARAVELDGPLDRRALQAALDAVVARHEALRTTLCVVEGRAVPVVAAAGPVPLVTVDLDGDGARSASAVAWPGLVQEARRPFDLSRDPMLRATLFRLRADGHVLLLVTHHSACDRWSMDILVRELAECYTAHAAGRRPALRDLPVRYVDFAGWQRGRFRGEALGRDLAYWKERLGGLTPLELPTDRPRPARPAHRGAREGFRLPPDASAALEALGRQDGTTLFVTLLAAFQTLLHRYTGQDDIVVGSPVPGRTIPEFEGVVGLFANTLVLRGDLSGNPTFRQVLDRLREAVRGARDHQDLPFDKLVAELEPARASSAASPVQVMFELDDAPPAAPVFAGLTARPTPIDTGLTRCDLTLSLRSGADGIDGSLAYSADLFDAATIRRMLGHLETLLAAVVADPDRAVSALPLMSEPERRQMLVDWNRTRSDYPERCVHQLFEQQVERTPDAVSLVFEDRRLTYRELNRRANRLAHRLRALGVGPDALVGICVERSVEMVVGLLGILKAGGAYVPLDPTYPSERLEFMLGDAQPSVLLAQRRLAARLEPTPARILYLDDDAAAVAGDAEGNPPSEVTLANLAYVIYTSGSTGRPKGVLVPHRGLTNYLSWAVRAYDVAAGTGAPVHSPLGFDLTITSLFPPLLIGRTVVLSPEEQGVDALSAILRSRREFSLVKITPAHLSLLSQRLPASEAAGRARVLVIGGEALSWEDLAFWRQHAPGTRLINEYGPTETVVGCCVYEASAHPVPRGPVPIGRPIANTQLYVLDRHRQPVPIGVRGELYIGGDGVARGYLNRPELTAARFVPDPFSAAPGARLYRTGDLARYLPDGTLEFVGRIDQQVKVRGYRIEPGEIEAVLEQHPAVGKVVVAVREALPGDRYLVAYLEARGDARPSPDELRRYLARRLPPYMVPSAFVLLAAIPMTPNGKVDRAALPAASRSDLLMNEREPVSARDDIEARLVRIWETVLSVWPIGVTHDFFQLGGHSVLAAQMFAQLYEQLGVALPLATLFQVPTIAGLAALIREGPRASSARSLVAVHAGGSRPPVFAVPGVGGNVLGYRDLARLLGEEQPFYGLQSRGLDGSEPPLTRIEDIAATFLDEIRTVQPEGPYYLAGACMGGVVAWELAQQLRAAGQEVGLLALLDTWPPTRGAISPLPIGVRGLATLEFLAGRLRLYCATLGKLRGRQRFHYVRDRMKVLARSVARRDLLRGNRSEFYLRVVSQANLRAFQQYRPRPYAGPVALFRAAGRKVADDDDPRLAWRALATDGLEVYRVPGDDSGLMLQPPHVSILASRLGARLERAQLEASSPLRV